MVSHVGYVGQEMDMSLLEAQHAVWSLEPRVIPIQEVVIRAVNPEVSSSSPIGKSKDAGCC